MSGVRKYLAERKAAREKAGAGVVEIQVKEVTAPEVQVKEVTATVTVEGIVAEAEVITDLLDVAATDITARKDPSLANHLDELNKIRRLVQRIRHQEDMRTTPVAGALPPLKAAMARLLEAASGASQQLDNAMDEVSQASKNLQQRLPGDLAVAEKNEAESGFQINAAIGGDRQEGRLIVEARENKAKNADQINAPMFGDAAGLALFVQAMQRAR